MKQMLKVVLLIYTEGVCHADSIEGSGRCADKDENGL